MNEARFGFNRINITFAPNVVENPADYGIRNGIGWRCRPRSREQPGARLGRAEPEVGEDLADGEGVGDG